MSMDYSKINVSILGSTGSVGEQAVCVCEELGVKIDILAAGRNAALLAKQAKRLNPRVLSVADSDTAAELQRLTDGKFDIIYGADALEQAIISLKNKSGQSTVVHSIAGLDGTRYALAAADAGVRLAMANKEAIIAAGDMIRERLERSGGMLIPVDSEHSAIFQCMRTGGVSAAADSVRRILLTASGGPFYGMTFDEMKNMPPSRTLAHPTWKMGAKITVDSATLMNKGFEVMEAVRLFGVTPDKIEVLVHRQSIIHSMVEYIDNTVLAQLASPDMRSCIRYALSYPERAECSYGSLDFTSLSSLTFGKPDFEAFPLLGAAYDAIKEGGTTPAALISADEAAVAAYLSGKISFGEISYVVSTALDRIQSRNSDSIEQIYEAVREAGEKAETIIGEITGWRRN